MANINFILPISSYTGFSVDNIVSALLSGETFDDICVAFQAISSTEKDTDEKGFFYDYLSGIVTRYPDILVSINELRQDNDFKTV